MGPSFHRAHARWPCNIEVELFIGQTKGRSIGRGLLMDISLSGALLHCTDDLKVGSHYRLRPDGASDKTEFPFRVAREIPSGDDKKKIRLFGLTFVVSPEQDRKLRLLIDRLPRENTLEEDKRDRSARDYWSS